MEVSQTKYSMAVPTTAANFGLEVEAELPTGHPKSAFVS
jgi:hypothetical protein